MIIPVTTLILTALAWMGGKAVPAVWHHHVYLQQVKEARHLCDVKGDCDVYKQLVSKGN